MPQAAKLRMNCAEQRVIGMAGVARTGTRHQIIFKVLGWNVAGVVYGKTFAEVVHDMTGEAELCALGPFHVLGKPEPHGQGGHNKQCHESKDFSAARARKLNPQGYQQCESQRSRNEQNLDDSWR